MSTSTAKSVTVGTTCKPGLTCSLLAYDTLLQVNGTKQSVWKVAHQCGPNPAPFNFTATYPVIDPGAAPDAQAVVRYSSCTVPGTPQDPSGEIQVCPDAGSVAQGAPKGSS